MFAENDFVHGVVDGFQPLQLLDLPHYRRLTYVDQRRSAPRDSHQAQQSNAGRDPNRGSHHKEEQNRACNKTREESAFA